MDYSCETCEFVNSVMPLSRTLCEESRINSTLNVQQLPVPVGKQTLQLATCNLLLRSLAGCQCRCQCALASRLNQDVISRFLKHCPPPLLVLVKDGSQRQIYLKLERKKVFWSYHLIMKSSYSLSVKIRVQELISTQLVTLSVCINHLWYGCARSIRQIQNASRLSSLTGDLHTDV